MSSLLQYFGVAYLINLPERKDRLRSAKNELARIGWPLGPDGVRLYAARKFTDSGGFPGNPGVRGCFHSHSECIRAAQREGKKSVLLIEDDIALSSAIRRLTPSIISQLEAAPWDFFYLGHESTGDLAKADSHTNEVRLLPIKTEITTTHFFAVNSRIFVRLLAHLDRVTTGIEGDQEFGPMPIDGALNIFRRINPDVRGLLAAPKLGWQRPSRSEISPRAFDAYKPLQPLVDILRDLKHLTGRWRT